MYLKTINFQVPCSLEDLLSVLKEYHNKGVKMISLEMDNELDELKVIPVISPLSNSDIHPRIIKKKK